MNGMTPQQRLVAAAVILRDAAEELQTARQSDGRTREGDASRTSEVQLAEATQSACRTEIGAHVNVTVNGDHVLVTSPRYVLELTTGDAHGLALRLTTAAREVAAAPRPLIRRADVDRQFEVERAGS